MAVVGVVVFVFVVGLAAVVVVEVVGVLDGYGIGVCVLEEVVEEGTRMRWLQGQ
jgi:hypothetical protein